MICSKCNGQGVVARIEQLDGDEESTCFGVCAALLTLGLSLPFTTRLNEYTCPRCFGAGKVGVR